MPPLIREGIDNYAEKRLQPGGFVMAVLSNDLLGAFATADTMSELALRTIVQYCHNEIPYECWGSSAKVTAWLKGRE